MQAEMRLDWMFVRSKKWDFEEAVQEDGEDGERDFSCFKFE